MSHSEVYLVKGHHPLHPNVPVEATIPPPGMDIRGLVVTLYGATKQKAPAVKGMPDLWFPAEIRQVIVLPDGRYYDWRAGCICQGIPTLNTLDLITQDRMKRWQLSQLGRTDVPDSHRRYQGKHPLLQ